MRQIHQNLYSFVGACTFVAVLIAGVVQNPATASDRDEAYHRDYVTGEPLKPTDAWRIARGGRLYDNWYAVTEADKPKSTHPAWPSSNTQKKDETTWRCKSCHGWDFLGKDGKYGSGSYKTGIKGVRGVIGRPVDDIMAVLTDTTHRYTDKMIPKNDMGHLAFFLSNGQYDVTKYVNQDGTVNGDVNLGAGIFQNTCAACHGFDGRALNWGDEKKPAYIGTEASSNPWEIMAKIRHGHPGTEMIAFSGFPMKDAADVLAYAQTLPVK